MSYATRAPLSFSGSHPRITKPQVSPVPKPLNGRLVRAALSTDVGTQAPKADLNSLAALLKGAAAAPGSVPAPQMLAAILQLEKLKAPADSWDGILKAPGKRWRLVFISSSKDVAAATKGGKVQGGQYFPITACQKYEKGIFENGVFLGPVASLTFSGPYTMSGRQLWFDVVSMSVGLGPWRTSFNLKQDSRPLSERDAKEVKALPFFLYSYIDEDIVVGRGRGGGMAVWLSTDKDWEARNGVLQVYK